MKVLTRAPVGTPDWTLARSGRITATRGANWIVSGMPGAYTYKSKLEEFLDLQRELSGIAPPEPEETQDDDRAARMRWGTISEPLHLELLREETGWSFTPEHAVFGSEKHDWLAASVDAFVARDSGPVGLAELKATNQWGAARDWKDGNLPMLYQVQLAIELAVTGLSWGIVSNLAPPSVQWGPVEFDEKINAWVMEELERFWDAVQRDQPPSAEASERDINALRELSRPNTGSLVYFSPAACEARAKWHESKRLAEEAERLEKEAKVVLIEEMVRTQAELGVFPEGDGFSYKGQTKNLPAQAARVVQVKPFLRYLKSAL